MFVVNVRLNPVPEGVIGLRGPRVLLDMGLPPTVEKGHEVGGLE
jgi:hypothetical protein